MLAKNQSKKFKPNHHPRTECEYSGKHPADIKAALTKAGYSQKRIALDLDVSHVTVNLVIKGVSTSRKIADYIAEKTGLSLEEMWPGRYTETENSIN